MSTPTIDFSKYESQAPSIDFSKYESKPEPSGPSDDWLKAHYANYGDTSVDQARERYNKRGMLDKIGDFMQDHNVVDNMTQHAINAIDAGKSGEYAKAANEGVKSVAPIALAHLPGQWAVRPLATLAGVGTGMVGGAVTQGVAKAAGATPDQAELSGTVGGILSGAAGMNAPKALPLVGKVAGKITDAVDPDLLGLFSPRAAAGLRWISKAGKVAGKLSGDSGGLAEVVQPHADKVTELSQQLADALSKANALPPEGPTAKAIDVPDLRVQPGQQAPQNLLNKPAVAQAQPQPQGGAFQVVPPEGAIQESKLPNMEIYKEPMLPPKPVKPPTLLEQLRQWDQIRQIHSQLEDQIGKGQDELQQWMEDHNQQTPGGKSTAATTAKARFDAARAKAESKANAVPSDTPQYSQSVSKPADIEAGYSKLQNDNALDVSTPEGKEFTIVRMRMGSSQNAPTWGYKIQQNGRTVANSGRMMEPAEVKDWLSGLNIKGAADEPRVPTSDADMENLLMKSVQNAKAKKAMSAKAGD